MMQRHTCSACQRARYAGFVSVVRGSCPNSAACFIFSNVVLYGTVLSNVKQLFPIDSILACKITVVEHAWCDEKCRILEGYYNVKWRRTHNSATCCVLRAGKRMKDPNNLTVFRCFNRCWYVVLVMPGPFYPNTHRRDALASHPRFVRIEWSGFQHHVLIEVSLE